MSLLDEEVDELLRLEMDELLCLLLDLLGEGSWSMGSPMEESDDWEEDFL